jgi:hypothetical protein
MKPLDSRRLWTPVLSLLLILAAGVSQFALPRAAAASAHNAPTVSPVPLATPAGGEAGQTPDALEDNWSPATAAPIAVGVVYDLNFVCPVVWGCAGGDHDYLRLPVKRGLRYLVATFDLGPGVDTELDLFWGSEEQPIAGNDDAIPGHGFLSAIRWVAPGDGEAIIRVAPRAGSTTPAVFDAQAGSYHFAVALAGSGLARQIESRIAGQTNATPSGPDTPRSPAPASPANPPAAPPARPPAASAPPPSTPPTPAPAPIAATGPSGLTARGQAIVRVPATDLRIAPNPNASLIQTLPAETLVTLAGQYNGLWVSVTTADSVLPGWVLGTDLRRVAPGQATAAISGTSALPTTAPVVSPTPLATPAAATTSQPRINIRPIAPLPAEPVPAPAPASSLTISVTLRAALAPPAGPPSRAVRTPTPAPALPLAGMRVQLVDAFGALLAEALTSANGQVALTRELAANQAVTVRVPAAGLELPVDPNQPEIIITLPGGGS